MTDLEVPPWECTICGMVPVLTTDGLFPETLSLVCQCVSVHLTEGTWLSEIHKPVRDPCLYCKKACGDDVCGKHGSCCDKCLQFQFPPQFVCIKCRALIYFYPPDELHEKLHNCAEPDWLDVSGLTNEGVARRLEALA